MSACLTQNRQEEKNLQLTWHPSQGQQKLFFQVIILLLSSMLSFLEFGACLTQNSMVQEQPVVVKRTLRELFGQNLLDRMMTQKCSLAAEYCSKW